MKVLLTGGNGFLAKAISNYTAFDQLISLARSKSTINCDLSILVPNLPIIDIVIHAAGKAHSVPKTEAESQEFFNVNVKGTENLLKGLEQAPTLPKSFIFISSVSVYGADFGINIVESSPLNAVDPYGKSKIQAEEIVRNWCAKNNVTCGILRLPLIVGPNPPGNLGAMIRGVKNGYYFNIAGGKAKKSMVMAEDVARVISRLAEVGGTYNLTDGYNPSFNELSIHIAKQLGKNKVLNMPKIFAVILAKIGDVWPKFPLNSNKLNKVTADLTFNDDKARSALGWSPSSVLDAFKI